MRFSIYNFCHFNQICISYNPIKRWFLTVILSFQYNVYHIIVNQHKNFSVKLQLIKEKQQKNLILKNVLFNFILQLFTFYIIIRCKYFCPPRPTIKSLISGTADWLMFIFYIYMYLNATIDYEFICQHKYA